LVFRLDQELFKELDKGGDFATAKIIQQFDKITRK